VEFLGQKYDASVIGGLLIAWLNTAPEAIFFVTALVSDNPRFAVGAVSGSSIVVCTVALGACLWIGASARKSQSIHLQPQVKRQCMLLGCSTLIPLTIAVVGFNYIVGVVAVGFYVAFIFHSLGSKLPEEDKHDLEADADEHEPEQSLLKGVLFLIFGGGMICFFSKPFIVCVVNAASTLHVNPILLAFFLAPIASEMPEILESISLARKGNSQNINIAFSNLIGGTITKTTLLCGVFCFFGVRENFAWESPSYSLSLLLLAVCAAAAAGIGYLPHRQKGYHGLMLFGLFVVVGCIQYFTNASFQENIDIETTLT